MKNKQLSFLANFLLILFIVFGFVGAYAQAGPGNVSSNLVLWMRADKGVATTGTSVDSWQDQSTNAFIGNSQGTGKATLVNSGLNFNPILRFAGNAFYNLGNPAALNIQPNSQEMTIISAVVTTGSTTGTVISRATNNNGRSYQLWFGQIDRVLHHTLGRTPAGPSQAVRWGTIYALKEPKITGGVVSNTGNNLTRLSPYMNGVLDPYDRNDGTDIGSSNVDVLIGARRETNNTGSGFRFNGDMGEIIIYNKALSTFERNKVETYLAIKYGITLGFNDSNWCTSCPPGSQLTSTGYAGTSNDYIASNNSILWSGVANAGFGFNVFGIARDDDSSLLQLKSRSVNVEEVTSLPSLLVMESEVGSLSTNLSYLLVGRNSGTVTLDGTPPQRMTDVLKRVWKARESTNDVGTVKLSFELNNHALSSENTLQLIVADNTSFTNYKNYQGTYNASTQVLTFTGVNLNDNEYFTLGHVQELNDSYHIDFNGTSEYVEEQNVSLSGLSGSTLMAWVKLGASFASEGLVLGQDNFNMRVTSTKVLRVQYNGINVNASSGFNLQEGVWTHIAAVYDGSDPVKTVKLYINGIERGSASSSPTLNASANNLIRIGRNPSANNLYFKGSIDEARVFNTALTEEQLRQIIYQEIQANGANTQGKIIPFDIGTTPTSTTVPWNRLLVYHNMSNIIGNCLIDKSISPKIARIYGIPNSSIKTQTAPMPFVTTKSGLLDVAIDNPSNGVIGTDATTYDWSIVQIKHTGVSYNASQRHLGLLVDKQDATNNPITFNITGDSPLYVTWYLKLNGKIDLTGKSQLIQTLGSVLDPTSSGILERDQQGTVDVYKYNYWSAPVGTPNSTTNNNNYSISSVVLDGNNPAAPIGLNYTTVFDGSAGPPATLSTRWMFKFDNAGNNINNWIAIGSTGTVQAGKGYIHKGTNSGLGYQNYTFQGKPHNGQIQYTISGDRLTLLGNPYASALDSEAFINDNLNAIDGALYFWEHWGGGTHRLLDYQGGYAVLNLSGGTPAISHPDVNQTGGGTVTPGRFVPVGQGFFVIADVDGGTLTFNNNQRAFVRENDTDVNGNQSNNLVKANKPKEITVSLDSHFTDNSQDAKVPNNFKRIRLFHFTTQGFKREILLAFTQGQATEAYDNGYDAQNLDGQPEDMYFMLDDKKLFIQGVGEFDENKSYLLGIKNAAFGKIKIGLEATENLSEDVSILIFDRETGLTHNLREGIFEVELSQIGEFNDRFRIQFTDQTLSLDDFAFTSDELKVFHTPENHVLHVQNTRQDLSIHNIKLFDLLGRSILSTDTDARNQSSIEIKLPAMSTGVYLVKLTGESGSAITRKLVIE